MTDEINRYFKYQPEWQGPLSGRSFEKQTEDAINRVLAVDPANASNSTPLPPGVASAGVSGAWSRGDHVHPPQTDITGNAATASRLETTRSITLSGDATGTTGFNGAGDATIQVSIQNATTAHKGMMSAADKTKLNNIEAGANNYVLPEATTSVLGGVRVDDSLNVNSNNPVRNSAITGSLITIEAALTSRITTAMINALFE